MKFYLEPATRLGIYRTIIRDQNKRRVWLTPIRTAILFKFMKSLNIDFKFDEKAKTISFEVPDEYEWAIKTISRLYVSNKDHRNLLNEFSLESLKDKFSKLVLEALSE